MNSTGESVSDYLTNHAATATKQAPPLQNGGGGAATGIFEVIMVLAVIVVGIVLLAKFLKRRILTKGNGLLEILEIQPLMQNRSIAVVKLGEHVYLLGVGNEIRLLDTIRDQETIQQLLMREKESAGEGFDKLLREKLAQLVGQRKSLESWDRSE